MNIAICDDEKAFLKQLRMKISSLKIHDCQISEFTSGQELLSNFVKGMYEIIILDVEMPGLNGLETAERIRQTDKSVIISFLTNYSEFAVKGYEVGAFRYILKNQPDYAYMEQLLSVFDEYILSFISNQAIIRIKTLKIEREQRVERIRKIQMNNREKIMNLSKK